MATTVSSGTQTSVITTEHTLADILPSSALVYQIEVDVGAMLAGDTTELRVYIKVLSGSGLNSALYQQFTGAPTGNGDVVVMSMPIVTDVEIKFTLKQTAGSPRAYPWKVYSF